MYAVTCNVPQYSILYATLAKHSLIFIFLYAIGIICPYLLVDTLTAAPCFAGDNHIINTSILTSCTTTL